MRSNRCWRCNKPLRVEKSVARGIGPKCFRKIKKSVFSRGGEIVEEEGALYVKYPRRKGRLIQEQMEMFDYWQKVKQERT